MKTLKRNHDKIRSYTELMELDSFSDRFRYLLLGERVGRELFGTDRYLNQMFYTSAEWSDIRNEVIARDLGCDLGCKDHEIKNTGIIVHHMNPIDISSLVYHDYDALLNPEFLITTIFRTHNALHYGDESILISEYTERTPFDTCPWKQ